eukprot:5988907-Pyramimonas_sp.AAC.1
MMIHTGFGWANNPRAPGWARPIRRALQERKHARNIEIDQCAVGLRDSHGTYIKKFTHIMCIHPGLMTPFSGAKCSGRRERSRVRSVELAAAQQHARAPILCFR